MKTVEIAAVPEHFTIPLLQGIKKNYFSECPIHIQEHPHGTGSMVRSLESRRVDIAIALTEGLVAAKLNEKSKLKVVATYVDSPLHWASVAGYNNSQINSLKDLKDKTFGISRFGSGSHIMSYILADNEGWNASKDIKFKVAGGLEQLLQGVEKGEIDTFMWERYMLRPSVSGKRVKYIGDTITPWPCFMIAAHENFIENRGDELKKILIAIRKSTESFKANVEESLTDIQKYCSLNSEDSKTWFNDVRFSKDGSVSKKVLETTVKALTKTGVLETEKYQIEDLISLEFTHLVE